MNRLLEFYSVLFIENLVNEKHVWKRIRKRLADRRFLTLPALENDILLESEDDTMEDNSPAEILEELRALHMSPGGILEELLGLQLPAEAYEAILDSLFDTGNDSLAILMSVDPLSVADGPVGWSVVVNELWDILRLVDVTKFEGMLQRVSQYPQVDFSGGRKFYLDNEEHMACMLAWYAKNGVLLEPLRKTFLLLEKSDPNFSYLADKCLTLNMADLEWIRLHRDAFILHSRNVDEMVDFLVEESLFSHRDKRRIGYCNSERKKAAYILEIIERKSRPGTVDTLIDACEYVGNRDLALMMSYQPSDLHISLNEFKLLQLNWIEIVNTVAYEDLKPFAGSESLNVNIRLKLSYSRNDDKEKIRDMLQLLPISKRSIYDEFFFYLTLKYNDLFERSFPMGKRETQSLLETQDFIALNMRNSSGVIQALDIDRLLTPCDIQFLETIADGVKKNLAICTILKRKHVGTVDKFRNILWKTDNRDCAEVLAVCFDRFSLNSVEWAKLKQNWFRLTKEVNARNLMLSLVKADAISLNQVKWVLKSAKNKQRMRKVLRILPSKERGFELLLHYLASVPSHHRLLEECTPMSKTDLEKIENSLDFLVHNTNDLPTVLNHLVTERVLSANEADVLNCYECPEQELYMLMMGKSFENMQKLVSVLARTDNLDAACVISMNTNEMPLSQKEWRDFLDVWPEFASQSYEDVRTILMTTGVLFPEEDEKISRISDNDDKMRFLLCELPYRSSGVVRSSAKMMKEVPNRGNATKPAESAEINYE